MSRYAGHKVLRATFSAKVDAADLASIGTVVSMEDDRAVIEVPRAGVAAAAAALLRSYPVSDLDVGEASIDDVVRRLFSGA